MSRKIENRRLLQDRGILSRIFETAATARLQVGVMLVHAGTSLRQVNFQQEIGTVENEDVLIKESSRCPIKKRFIRAENLIESVLLDVVVLFC